MDKRIVIIGAGPMGLGASYRLQELNYHNWFCVEQHPYPGGLSASFKDPNGFWWDVGGHVLFSHFKYFDDAFESVMRNEYLMHQRSSWIRIAQTFVPYPFQNNIRYLPPPLLYDCLLGLIKTRIHNSQTPLSVLQSQMNFLDWCLRTFGDGITRYFMAPYNRKNWATPLELLSAEWIAERVSVIDLERILKNIIFQLDDIDWGPNNCFKFPLNGGTGEIFRRLSARLGDKIQFNRQVVSIEPQTKILRFADGSTEKYDILISAMPLTELLTTINPKPETLITTAHQGLTATSGIVVGIGLQGTPPPEKRCWIYFPESNCPFYRVTYFHNYSPNNVPGSNFYSFMCETSYSSYKPVNKSSIIDDTIQGLINSGILSETERDKIVSTFVIDVPYSYPVPTLERNKALSMIIPELQKWDIYSRGRFGLWLYEIGNMDHCFMQGVELIDHLLLNKQEVLITSNKFWVNNLSLKR